RLFGEIQEGRHGGNRREPPDQTGGSGGVARPSVVRGRAVPPRVQEHGGASASAVHTFRASGVGTPIGRTRGRQGAGLTCRLSKGSPCLALRLRENGPKLPVQPRCGRLSSRPS